MPVDHVNNRANGDALDKLRIQATNGPYSALAGHLTGLPIYEIKFMDFVNSKLAGANVTTVVRSITRNDLADRKNGYRQPTNHEDRAGNLPLAVLPKLGYREYYLAGNGFTKTGYVRLVGDITNKRLYITPTHYDAWNDGSTARNPFFLFRSVGLINPLFD